MNKHIRIVVAVILFGNTAAMAAAQSTISLSNDGTLSIIGTETSESFRIVAIGGEVQVKTASSGTRSFDAAIVKRIEITTGRNFDEIRFLLREPLVADVRIDTGSDSDFVQVADFSLFGFLAAICISTPGRATTS